MTERKSRRGRRWLTARAPRRTIRGRRIRALFRAFMVPLVAGDPLHQAAAMTCAELTVAAEDARARLLDGDTSAEEAGTRVENAARRVRDDLAPLIPKPLSWWEQRQREREQEDSDGQEES
jgi:hypothetical protein